MNWKTETAAAIVTHAAPVTTADNSDLSLWHQLKAAVEGGTIAERDLAFATSLSNGFVKYGSFTPKQRPHVERLIAAPAAPVEGPDALLARSLEAALPYVATKDQGFALSLLNGLSVTARSPSASAPTSNASRTASRPRSRRPPSSSPPAPRRRPLRRAARTSAGSST